MPCPRGCCILPQCLLKLSRQQVRQVCSYIHNKVPTLRMDHQESVHDRKMICTRSDKRVPTCGVMGNLWLHGIRTIAAHGEQCSATSLSHQGDVSQHCSPPVGLGLMSMIMLHTMLCKRSDKVALLLYKCPSGHSSKSNQASTIEVAEQPMLIVLPLLHTA